jgi:hypothetical protein
MRTERSDPFRGDLQHLVGDRVHVTPRAPELACAHELARQRAIDPPAPGLVPRDTAALAIESLDPKLDRCRFSAC